MFSIFFLLFLFTESSSNPEPRIIPEGYLVDLSITNFLKEENLQNLIFYNNTIDNSTYCWTSTQLFPSKCDSADSNIFIRIDGWIRFYGAETTAKILDRVNSRLSSFLEPENNNQCFIYNKMRNFTVDVYTCCSPGTCRKVKNNHFTRINEWTNNHKRAFILTSAQDDFLRYFSLFIISFGSGIMTILTYQWFIQITWLNRHPKIRRTLDKIKTHRKKDYNLFYCLFLNISRSDYSNLDFLSARISEKIGKVKALLVQEELLI